MFTIPRVLRGLFDRERRLLTLLSQCSYEAVRRTFTAIVGDHAVVPGFVSSIQTFGSFAVNFHAHIHALVTEGVRVGASRRRCHMEGRSGPSRS